MKSTFKKLLNFRVRLLAYFLQLHKELPIFATIFMFSVLILPLILLIDSVIKLSESTSISEEAVERFLLIPVCIYSVYIFPLVIFTVYVTSEWMLKTSGIYRLRGVKGLPIYEMAQRYVAKRTNPDLET